MGRMPENFLTDDEDDKENADPVLAAYAPLTPPSCHYACNCALTNERTFAPIHDSTCANGSAPAYDAVPVHGSSSAYDFAPASESAAVNDVAQDRDSTFVYESAHGHDFDSAHESSAYNNAYDPSHNFAPANESASVHDCAPVKHVYANDSAPVHNSAPVKHVYANDSAPVHNSAPVKHVHENDSAPGYELAPVNDVVPVDDVCKFTCEDPLQLAAGQLVQLPDGKLFKVVAATIAEAPAEVVAEVTAEAPAEVIAEAPVEDVQQAVAHIPAKELLKHNGRKVITYVILNVLALRNSPGGMLYAEEIYCFIQYNFRLFRGPMTKELRASWQSSVRHALCFSGMFMKMPQLAGEKNCRWTLDCASQHRAEKKVARWLKRVDPDTLNLVYPQDFGWMVRGAQGSVPWLGR